MALCLKKLIKNIKNSNSTQEQERSAMTDCTSIMGLTTMLSLGLFVCSVAFPLMQLIFSHERMKLQNISSLMLKYALFFNVGGLFIMGCAGQFLYAKEISSCLGLSWSPFQYELGFSELGLAVLGLLCPLFQRQFWLATIIATSVWLMGASGVHLYYYFQGNESIINASFVIFWNLFMTSWLLTFYVIHTRSWRLFGQAAALWRGGQPSLTTREEL